MGKRDYSGGGDRVFRSYHFWLHQVCC